jgi:hypothetical protein
VDSLIVDGALRPASLSYTFVAVTAPHTIRAVFAIDEFTIAASAGANGAISPSGVVRTTYGSTVQFLCVPAPGYHVDSLIVDGVQQPTAARYTFASVVAQHDIRVTFAINTFTITTSAGPNGAIVPAGVVTVDSGASKTFVIIPDTTAPSYLVATIMVDGIAITSTRSYTFANVVGNHTIAVTFKRNSPPSAPLLVRSSNGDTSSTPGQRIILFRWTASTDPDPGDTLSYSLLVHQDLGGGGSFDTTITSLRDTSSVVNLTGRLEVGGTFWWTVRATDGHFLVASPDTFRVLVTGVNTADAMKPLRYALAQNYPNPFNPTTTIGFELERESEVLLEVFNTSGQRVATLVNALRSAGTYTVHWNPALPSGVYIYRLAATSVGSDPLRYEKVMKMVLVR